MDSFEDKIDERGIEMRPHRQIPESFVGERNALAGALALACLMLPVVIRTSEEMLRLVPDELRQASLALGARKWRTVVTVVLPAAISGITSGSLLALARAAGETAPIVLVVGITYRPNWSLSKGNTSLPAQIYSNATQPYEGAQARGWGAATGRRRSCAGC